MTDTQPRRPWQKDPNAPKRMAGRKWQAIRWRVLTRDSFTCQLCGRLSDPGGLEVDHIQPLSKGGSDEMTNLRTACRSCNQDRNRRRGDKVQPHASWQRKGCGADGW